MDKLVHAAGIVAMGALLGVGFWASKKLTQKIDDKIAEYDGDLIERVRSRFYVVKDQKQEPVTATV